MNNSTYLELIDMKEYALDKIKKAELTLTEINMQYGQAENQDIIAARNVLYNNFCKGITPQGAEKQIYNWALDYSRINQKLEIAYDYIVACRMLLENCSE